MRKAITISASILLHLMIFITLIHNTTPLNRQQRQQAAASVEPMVTTFIDADVEDNAVGEAPSDAISQKGTRCPPDANIYIGIGFSYSRDKWEILLAPEYFPAYRAGLRVGDQLLTMPADDLPEGIEIQVHVNRGNHRLTFTAVTRKICFIQAE